MILTRKLSNSCHCSDGKRRNKLRYFLDGVLILEQKIPFETDIDYGFDRITNIIDEYLYNGKIYQTRIKNEKVRYVSFPIRKTVTLPKNIKIILNCKN